MSATGKLIQSLKAENYIDAKKHFTELVADKMRNALSREYRDVSRSFVKEDVTQVGPDPATNEANDTPESAKLTKAELFNQVKALGMRIKWDYEWGEYIVDYKKDDPRWSKNSTYHTDDRQDALDTAKSMAAWKKGTIMGSSLKEQDAIPPTNATADTKSPEELIRMIKAGDTVTISFPKRPGDKVPQTGRGKAVMPSKHGGWVLNMGGAYGKPGIADEDNIVSFRRNGGKPIVARRG